ncbi:conserved hypothetical protein [Formosa agariphila KMM 3901]|uniref:Tetracyclin repressor-like C-terminal domain-containing protein n=1 Tax=Formosa agariphila (strain DSM 15362 / KCTC 12365 / LMG 23005 / KMM 3901 / M-2Alg 35-1) TaxID=1347342 RepID=T2KM55_FORAG|nr:TetR family transcriptional regulator C-terminal domain-containing protein [Formosa agariphila]CDF79543.1 conserved hypothetical protein [Formosa agariphila KMM 3901]
MPKKKTITAHDIMSLYMDYVLEHNERPKTVYAFAKANQFDEQKFYEFFGSFDAIESHVFEVFYNNTSELLNQSEDYHNFDARNKLLSFYFTFFELLTANRSFVIYALNQHKNSLKNLKVLAALKHQFTTYISQLGIDLIETQQAQLDKFQQQSLKESAWVQFMLTLKFWMDDTSPSFEKTDVFIEKSINTSFDILNVAPIKSMIDFGKFLFKEKVNI